MARKSGWQNFADNFNAVYGTYQKFAGDIESKDIMDEEVEILTADDGKQSWNYGGKSYDKEITSRQLRGLQYDRMATSMAKFGDSKGAMDMRLRASELKENQRKNDLRDAQFDDLVKKVGLNNAKVIADTKSTEATTADTQSKTTARDAKLPANLEGLNLDNTGKKTNIEGKQLDNAIKNQAYQVDKPLNDALIQFGKNAGEYKTDEEAKNAFFNIYSQFQPDVAQEMKTKYNAGEIKEIMQSGQKTSAKIQNILADPKKGIPGVVKWIDDNNGINTGAELVHNKDGSVSLYTTDQETGELLDEIVTGANEAELGANLQMYTTPGGATKLAAQMLDYRKSEATTGLATAKAKAEGKGRNYQDEQYKKAKADFQRSATFLDATDKNAVMRQFERIYWAEPGTAGGIGSNSGFTNMRKKNRHGNSKGIAQ